MDFLFMFIDLLSLGVTAEALRANIDWKSAFLKGEAWSVSAKFSRSSERPCEPFLHG